MASASAKAPRVTARRAGPRPRRASFRTRGASAAIQRDGIGRPCEPARARRVGRGEPVAAEGEGGAAVAEERAEPARADPAPARAAAEHDRAGAREHEESRAAAEGAQMRGLGIGEDGHPSRE